MSYDVVMKRIALLKHQSAILARLLDDPHPGLFTWIDAVARCREEIDAIMDGRRDE